MSSGMIELIDQIADLVRKIDNYWSEDGGETSPDSVETFTDLRESVFELQDRLHKAVVIEGGDVVINTHPLAQTQTTAPATLSCSL